MFERSTEPHNCYRDTLPQCGEFDTDAAQRGGLSPPAVSQAPPGPIQNRWALLVGVNRYVDPAFPRSSTASTMCWRWRRPSWGCTGGRG